MSVFFFTQSRPAVPANVVKSADLLFLVSNNNERFAGNILDKKISGLRNLTLMSHLHPSTRKNSFLFLRKDFRRNKILLRQGRRANRQRILSLSRRGVCLHQLLD